MIVATGGLLFVTESALNVWDRLAKGPAFLLYSYVAILLAIVITALVLIWRLVVRRRVDPLKRAQPPRLVARCLDHRAVGPGV